jgi:chromosome segregation ATPase
MASPSEKIELLEENVVYLSDVLGRLRNKNHRLKELVSVLRNQLADSSNAIVERDRRVLELSSSEDALNEELRFFKEKVLVLEESRDNLHKFIRIKDASFDRLKAKYDVITE